MRSSNSFDDVVSVEYYIKDFIDSLSTTLLRDFVIKGCMALKYSLDSVDTSFRLTRDLDIHCFNREDWDLFVENCCYVATNNSPNGITYTLLSRRGYEKNPNGDSLIIDADGTKFNIDMNIGSDVDFYEDEGTSIRFYSIPSILADKIYVSSKITICRRIKDLIDIYFILSEFDIEYYPNCTKIADRLNLTSRDIDFSNIFIYNESNIPSLEHAFIKYTESTSLDIDFEDMMDRIIGFTIPIYSYLNGKPFNYSYWSKEHLKWVE